MELREIDSGERIRQNQLPLPTLPLKKTAEKCAGELTYDHPSLEIFQELSIDGHRLITDLMALFLPPFFAGSSDMQGTSIPASDSVNPLQPKTPQEYVTVLSSWHIISWFVLIASIAPLSLESLCIGLLFLCQIVAFCHSDFQAS